MKSKEKNSDVLKWIFKRSKKYFPLVIVISVISTATALLTVSLALVSKAVLDVATGHREGDFWFYGILLVIILLSQIILHALNLVLNAYVNGKLTMSLRNYLFLFVARKKYPQITAFHSGDLLNRFTSDVDVVVSNSTSIIPNLSAMISRIVGGFYAIFILDKRIALIVLIFGFLIPAFGRIINKKFKQIHKKCQQSEGMSRSFMQECFENIIVVKTFISESPFSKRLNALLYNNFKLKMKKTKISLITHTALVSMFTIGYYLVLIWGASQISSGAITYGTLIAFLQLFGQLSTPLQNISGIIPQYYSAIASAERLMEIETGEEDLKPLSREELDGIKEKFHSIEVNNLTFSYKDETILKNCSFKAERGQITAITGESGSGKSTIFKIMLGLYEPQDGNITIDNDTVLNTSHRGLFAYVPQGNLLLSGSIKENITLCDDSISDDRIIAAAKAAEIYDFILTLPNGFDTLLSERGAGLSEGQIQRIAIARALLTNAPVLLLDEATSALDEATETKVLNNILQFTDKTIMFVTHRNTSLKVCSKIVRINDKKVETVK